MLRRRVNYRYLARLGERLHDLGHDIQEWPVGLLLESCWQEHKDYCKSELGLSYCVRCKLPIPEEYVDPGYADICIEHGKSFRASIELRQERSIERKLRYIPKAMVDPVKASIRRDISVFLDGQPESSHVGTSKPEPPTIKPPLSKPADINLPIGKLFDKLNEAKK